MGFFSWKTADTNESIMNAFTDECKTVYLLQPNGENIEEKAYQGYGVFGGVDALKWFEERNPGRDWEESIRPKKSTPFPLKFSFNKDARYEDLPASKNCPLQGYFK